MSVKVPAGVQTADARILFSEITDDIMLHREWVDWSLSSSGILYS